MLAAACRGPRGPRPGDVATRRFERGGGLCEDVHTILRPPGGRFDRIAVRRLGPCDPGGSGPVLLYLPGTHMNGELPRDERTTDVRRLLAARGVRVWSVDYRTHAVPPDASADDLAALAGWTADVFEGDVEAAGAIARAVDHDPIWVAGFSFGAGLAYDLAARDYPMRGLVILDGAPPERPGKLDAGDPAFDVGGGRLGWPDRVRLLDAVLADPAAPSPLSGFATAGDALVEIVHGARSFGGNGGLSAVKTGRADVRALAGMLATYDRWWPRAASTGAAVTPLRPLPVIAFATTNMGPAWVERVHTGARAFGGEAAEVHELSGLGHLDVLIGRDVESLVVPPILARMAPPS